MTNAVIIVTTDREVARIPVTWKDDYFVEGEELYAKIFQSNEIVDWESEIPDFDVVLDEDPVIRCRASYDDMAGTVFPNRKLSKLKGA